MAHLPRSAFTWTRLAGLVSMLLLSAAVDAGCAPTIEYGPTSTGAGGSPGGGGSPGAGGSFDASSSTGTGGALDTTSSTGAGSSGGYGYLCGGGAPACSPDPASSDCLPGGGPPDGGGPADGGALTCQLVPSAGGVTATCGLAGSTGEGFLCTVGSECQPGLGCVTVVSSLSVCRAYCCADPESCAPATYCAPLPLFGATQAVPVCAPVAPCQLLDGAPCPAGQACAIVRNDGTTSCVIPGAGVTGQACPCAAGYTCDKATDTCHQLCHLGSNECVNGTCQGGAASFPIDIGVCVFF